MLAVIRILLKNLCLISILLYKIVLFCKTVSSWAVYMGANAFGQNIAKLVISVNGKTHILAACWNAQLHSWKNQPVQKPSPVFSSLFGLELGDYFLFVCLFHLQVYISVVMHVCAGFWSEEMVPFWCLLRNKKTVFPLYVRSLNRNRQLIAKRNTC